MRKLRSTVFVSESQMDVPKCIISQIYCYPVPTFIDIGNRHKSSGLLSKSCTCLYMFFEKLKWKIVSFLWNTIFCPNLKVVFLLCGKSVLACSYHIFAINLSNVVLMSSILNLIQRLWKSEKHYFAVGFPDVRGITHLPLLSSCLN